MMHDMLVIFKHSGIKSGVAEGADQILRCPHARKLHLHFVLNVVKFPDAAQCAFFFSR